MTTCTIIISHYESLPFLRACIRQIRKYANENVKQEIIIVDQSSKETWEKVKSTFIDEEINIIHAKPLYSGYGIDYCIRYFGEHLNTDYIAQIHTDAFPIHPNWLYLPIKLIEEYNLSFVGQLQFINGKDNLASIYPPNAFFAMAQCFNVARKETYEEMSTQAGFTRYHNRPKSGLTFKNDDWERWASDNYAAKGSDDDVVAFCWLGRHREADMIGLAVTGFIQPQFGRLIDDLVFHFGSANEARGVMIQMPQQYQDLTRRINENYSDELIEEMLSLARAKSVPAAQILTRNYWNGKTKESSPPTEELNKRIEELKL